MKIDLDDFKVNFEPYKKFLSTRLKYPLDAASEFSAVSGVPVLVILYYTKNILEDVEGIDDKIQNIVDFYDYTEVVGEDKIKEYK